MMTDMLALIAEKTRRLQTDIALLQEKQSLITDHDLERLVRSSQRLSIRCREMWAASRDDNYTTLIAPTKGGSVYLPDWSVCVCDDEVVEIALPLLLPKRTCPDAAFVTEPFELVLSAYHPDLPRFRRCYVLFRHVYGPELTVRDIRDHDNTESRKVLNVIERYLLTSDSGYYCTTIHQTTQGAKTKTLILLTGSSNYMEGVLRDEAYQRLPDG